MLALKNMCGAARQSQGWALGARDAAGAMGTKTVRNTWNPRFSQGVFQSVRTLFIQTHATPNPLALKFTPSMRLVPESVGAVEVSNVKEALARSDLAFKLLSIDDKRIASVLLGTDFVTVVKTPDADDWALIKPQIFSVLTEHLSMGQPAVKAEYLAKLQESQPGADEDLSEYEEVVMLIKELIHTRIRPAILEDGGDVVFVDFDMDQGRVTLKLIGACKSCGSSEVTLKNGIEEMLRYYIDEVKVVEQVKDDDEAPADVEPAQHATHSHSHSDLPPSL